MPDDPLFAYTLGLADDALILGHRLSEWCGRAPMLEEELALANIALDLIGAARALYAYAGTVEGAGRDEDALAYRRDPAAFRNLLLVEQPNGDFAATIARLFLYAAFRVPFWTALAASRDGTLAAVAATSRGEAEYHRRHAGAWLVRLGDGTAESRRRAQQGLAETWPCAGEMFEMDDATRALAASGIAVDAAGLRPGWDTEIDRVLAEATLTRPPASAARTGGRQGRHTPHLAHLLAEMQTLPRAFPGAVW